MRYSLAQVEVNITRGDTRVALFGGNGSMIGSVTIERATERFSVAGDATGGYVVNETLDATGTVTLSVRQFAPLVTTLTNIFNQYDLEEGYGIDSTDQGGVNITLTYRGITIAEARDCFLNMPEIAFEEEAGDRDFAFVAGVVNFGNFDLPGMNVIKN